MEYKPTPKRPARPGETCSCGKPAVEVLFFNDLGPIPTCRDYPLNDRNSHRTADCPPWCTATHSAPFDRTHYSESHDVELDAYPYVDRTTGGEWMHGRCRITVGITKEPGARPAYIDITSHDDEITDRLTAYEADELAEALHKLAAMLRAEGGAR